MNDIRWSAAQKAMREIPEDKWRFRATPMFTESQAIAIQRFGNVYELYASGAQHTYMLAPDGTWSKTFPIIQTLQYGDSWCPMPMQTIAQVFTKKAVTPGEAIFRQLCLAANLTVDDQGNVYSADHRDKAFWTDVTKEVRTLINETVQLCEREANELSDPVKINLSHLRV